MKKVFVVRIAIGYLVVVILAVVAWAAGNSLSSGYISGLIGGGEPFVNGISWQTVSYGGGQRAAGGLVLEDCISLFQGEGVPTTPAAPSDLVKPHPYPNPFAPKDEVSRIKFPGVGESALLQVFDVSGREVARVERSTSLGVLEWDGKDDSSRPLASGVYIYVLKDGRGKTYRGKLAIVR